MTDALMLSLRADLINKLALSQKNWGAKNCTQELLMKVLGTSIAVVF